MKESDRRSSEEHWLGRRVQQEGRGLALPELSEGGFDQESFPCLSFLVVCTRCFSIFMLLVFVWSFQKVPCSSVPHSPLQPWSCVSSFHRPQSHSGIAQPCATFMSCPFCQRPELFYHLVHCFELLKQHSGRGVCECV